MNDESVILGEVQEVVTILIKSITPKGILEKYSKRYRKERKGQKARMRNGKKEV